MPSKLETLLQDISRCNLCATSLPYRPRPVLRAGENAKILVIGQAPGTRVHASGIPWDDPSGHRLRQWMNLTDDQFYDTDQIAIMPMGFCYPGKGRSGDLPPRPECARQWHSKIREQLPHIQSTLLIGQYAQKYYLPDSFKTLTERVAHWQEFAPEYFVLPHPSPRNQFWLQQHRWFENEVVPQLQNTVSAILSS